MFFTFLSALGAVAILRAFSPVIHNTLVLLDFEVDTKYVGKLKIFGYILPALVICVFAYSIRLHDRLSDLLRIRYNFDTKHIIRPMAVSVGVRGDQQIERLYSRRDELMRRIFYRYASSSSPKIDAHNIHEALDNWSWVWAFVESWFIFLLTGITLLFLTRWLIGFITLVLSSLVSALLIFCYLRQCRKYAEIQVQEILSNSEWKEEIRRELNALHY